MSADKILEKVRRLQALATSSNVHEAAAAAAAAQRIMAEYQIEEAELATDDAEPAPVGVEDFSTTTKRVVWKNAIAFALAEANGCGAWTSRGIHRSTFRIAGTREAVTLIRYMHNYLCAEVERLCKAERPVHATGSAWGNAFRLGAAYALAERIRGEARAVRREAEASGKGAALLRIDAQLARVQEVMPAKLRAAPRPRVGDGGGFVAGQRAGRQIGLNGHRALGAGAGQIPAHGHLRSKHAQQ